MHKFIFFLFTLISINSYCQKPEIKFDKFDSVYTISTRDKLISGKALRGDFMYAHSIFTWLKKAEYKNADNAKFFEVLLSFATTHSTVIDSTTEIKIQFSDNSFATYKQFSGESQIVIETGAVLFEIPDDDKLFTTDVKTIRISTSDANMDFEIPEKKAGYIKNALMQIKVESEKL